MTRIYRFTAGGTIILLTIYMQMVSMEIMGPGSMLWGLVENIQYGTINGEQWAERMYTNITVWFMWLIRAAVIGYLIYAEFTRENVTKHAPIGGPP